MSLLEINNVVKRFGGIRATNNITMTVDEGEVRGLIGPNGSGKTTLINLITGIYRIDAGTIYFNGQQIDGLAPNKIAIKGVMRTFQVARIFRDMTVLENMLVPGFVNNLSKREAEEKATELLDFALLTRLKDKPAKNLSGGQSMLLQIVRGFMNQDLKIYVMDEPFAGVHQSIKGIIIKAIKKMNREKGITFLIVSHEMQTVDHLCDKVSVVCKGELTAEGTMKEIANNPEVIDAYLGG